MEQRPFLCSKCGNWYTPVPLAEGEGCAQCALGTHIPHRTTGIVDCHYGQKSATVSEVRMTRVIQAVTRTRDALTAAQRDIGGLKTQNEVVALLTKVEASLAATELVTKDVQEILTWAGVFEMPGKVGEDPKVRFKSQDAIEELVKTHRRPQEDLDELRRSVKVCQALAAEIGPLVAEIRVAAGQVRQAASDWKAPVVTAPVAAKRRARKARAPKRAKQTPVQEPVAALA